MNKIGLIANFVDVVCFIILGESIIKKSKRGEKLFNLFESGVVRFTSWRANAEVKKEIGVVIKFFFICFAASATLLLLAFKLHFTVLATSLALVSALSVTGGLSLQWTFNHKEFIKPYVWILLFLLSGSALFLLVESIEVTHELTTVLMFEPFGIKTRSYWTALIMFWGVILSFFALMYALAWLVYGPISFAVVSILYLTHRVSKLLVRKFNRDLALTLVFVAAVIVRILGHFL